MLLVVSIQTQQYVIAMIVKESNKDDVQIKSWCKSLNQMALDIDLKDNGLCIFW